MNQDQCMKNEQYYTLCVYVCMYVCVCRWHAGKDNTETLMFIRDGGRMNKPTGCPIDCPQRLFEVMMHCWKQTADERPTFEFLYHLFDNFGTATEGQYQET